MRHLRRSCRLDVRPTSEVRAALKEFADDIYFHQVIARSAEGAITRYQDLDVALAQPTSINHEPPAEWRIHFHIPLHSKPTVLFDTTADHLLGAMDILKADPHLCPHIEMETYTWEVLPKAARPTDDAGLAAGIAAELAFARAQMSTCGVN